jgi:hypothetical protein
LQILFLTVRKPPKASAGHVSRLNSYPALLVDEPNTFHRVAALDPAQVVREVESFEPALLVYQGEPEVAEAWKNLGEIMFPRLLAYATSEMDPFVVMETLNQRLWGLRRQRLKPSGRAPAPEEVDPEQLFAALDRDKQPEARRQARRLLETYALGPLLEQVSTAAMERLLYCVALLETALEDVQLPEPLAVLDVGTHIWSYAPGLAGYFRHRASTLNLTGIELDPWYLQAQELLRGEWALHYARLAQATWYEGDLADLKLPPQDVICFFLPIVLPQNTVLWRIPMAYHHPVQLFKTAQWKLKPGGQMLIYNGVEAEYQETLTALRNAGLEPVSTGAYTCPVRQQPQGYVTRVVQRKRLGEKRPAIF